MAQRRMFSLKIVGSDAFLEMPTSARELYFQLGMYADDDGFVNPRKIMRMIGSSEDDIRVLVSKRFVLPFDNGVVVIKHWLINNLVRKDFYQETMYLEQKNSLQIKPNKAYTENVNNLLPQVRLGKDRNTSEATASPVYEIVADVEEKPRKVKSEAEKVFSIFLAELGKHPLNWKTNRTIKQSAENLLKERGEDKIRKALRFYKEHKDLPFCPQIITPWDLDTKWDQLVEFKNKQN